MYRLTLLCCVGLSVLVSGCTPRIGGQDYSVSDSGKARSRRCLVLQRPVVISNQRPENQGQPGAGAGVGAVTGGLVAGNLWAEEWFSSLLA